MTKRSLTRTWHPQPITSAKSSAPVAQVQDPAVRDILLTRRRALLMEAAEIAKHCGLAPDAPADEAV